VYSRILCYHRDSATTLAPSEQNIYRTKLNETTENSIGVLYLNVSTLKPATQMSNQLPLFGVFVPTALLVSTVFWHYLNKHNPTSMALQAIHRPV
jgi:hypothetical protein